MKILEVFCQGKYNDPKCCEDGVAVTEHFAMFIDGMTSKNDILWNGKTGGRCAMEILTNNLPELRFDSTMEQTVDFFTKAISDVYEEKFLLSEMEQDYPARWTASAIIYSKYFREIWMIGDCQCMIGDRVYCNEKHIDRVMGDARAFILEAEILAGKSIPELRSSDPGRTAIMPLLQRQKYFQNHHSSEFAYEVFDGFTIPHQLVKKIPVPHDISEIILASDGYPQLKLTLKETEQKLVEINSKDPLCFRENRSTKGLKKDLETYDDRTYLKISVGLK